MQERCKRERGGQRYAVDREGNGMKRFAFRATGRVQFCLCVICAHQEKMEAVLVVAGSKLQAEVLEWSVQ